MKYVVNRTVDDAAMHLAFNQLKKLKKRLALISIISLIAGVCLFFFELFAKFTIPLCCIFPFICFMHYRETKRKITLPHGNQKKDYNPCEFEHLSGDFTIDITQGVMTLSYEKCREKQILTKKDIKDIAFKHGYIFIIFKDQVIPIPNFDKMDDLKKDILKM